MATSWKCKKKIPQNRHYNEKGWAFIEWTMSSAQLTLQWFSKKHYISNPMIWFLLVSQTTEDHHEWQTLPPHYLHQGGKSLYQLKNPSNLWHVFWNMKSFSNTLSYRVHYTRKIQIIRTSNWGWEWKRHGQNPKIQIISTSLYADNLLSFLLKDKVIWQFKNYKQKETKKTSGTSPPLPNQIEGGSGK